MVGYIEFSPVILEVSWKTFCLQQAHPKLAVIAITWNWKKIKINKANYKQKGTKIIYSRGDGRNIQRKGEKVKDEDISEKERRVKPTEGYTRFSEDKRDCLVDASIVGVATKVWLWALFSSILKSN